MRSFDSAEENGIIMPMSTNPSHIVQNGVKSETMLILVVDDDPPSVKMISFLLREEGYDVIAASNGVEALRVVEERAPDLIILDIMMPHIDGLEVCRRIRERSNVPIIFLSAKGETSDRVLGLDMGADDYLAKPFEPAELLARVRAVLRRTETGATAVGMSRIHLSGFQLDPALGRLTLPSGKTVNLSPIEARLLYTLMRNAGRTLTHNQLFNSVWGYEHFSTPNELAVYMRRLRRKMEPDPNNPRYLITERGVGYRFEPDERIP